MSNFTMYWLAAIMAAMPSAALADDVPAAIAACRAETDDAKRLACYDREADRIAAGPAPAAAAAPAATPEERFGRRGKLAREEKDRKKAEARELGELVATVTEIWTRSDGLMKVTLDNGQVWSQNAPDPFFRLKTGDKVKIQPAVLGSFLMSGPSKRSTRVTRIE
jgi:hypothetical protein